MTTLVPRPPPNPSPSRSNPFARPFARTSGSFTRAHLLPTLPSPARATAGMDADSLTTPAEKLRSNGRTESGSEAQVGSAARTRSVWRLLWRGGLEVGRDGWRLEGVTFFALLIFPATPVLQLPNPFDTTPVQRHLESSTAATSASPFALPSAETDLCLSLESMRGRKYLQVRGVVKLEEGEVLDGGEEGGVQMSIAPHAALLAGYFTSLLCRDAKLSSQGRTLSAVLIGLGDEGVDSPNSTILVYGQLQDPDTDADGVAPLPGSLRLCVGRRRPPPAPPSALKVRPGEPLPRPPLFFPSKAPRKPPPPFPQRSRSISRAPSLASISSVRSGPPTFAAVADPGPSVMSSSTAAGGGQPLPPAPVSGRTPGRRGEKRRRTEDDVGAEERRRRAGKIVVPVSTSIEREPSDRVDQLAQPGEKRSGSQDESHSKSSKPSKPPEPPPPDEDTFGRRPVAKVSFDSRQGGTGDDDGPSLNSRAEPSSTCRTKRTRVPQQVLDNKAAIRKQTLLLLEARNVGREHEHFKEVFGMTTKGATFAFRAKLLDEPLSKLDVQDIVARHLDMYLPLPLGPARDQSHQQANDDLPAAALERISDLEEMPYSLRLRSEDCELRPERHGMKSEIDEPFSVKAELSLERAFKYGARNISLAAKEAWIEQEILSSVKDEEVGGEDGIKVESPSL